MAIIECPECKGKVSDKADSCPHCGYVIGGTSNCESEEIIKESMPRKSIFKNKRFILGVIIAVGVVVISTLIIFVIPLSGQNSIAVSKVIKEIDDLPEVKKASDYGKISDCMDDYNDLSFIQKVRVTNYSELKESFNEVISLRIDHVKAQIDKIGSVSLNSKSSIKYARSEYENLSDAEKNKVSNYKVLEEAEETYYQKVIENVESIIDKIGEITLNSCDAVSNAKKVYNDLDDSTKEKISNRDRLLKAESDLDEILIAEMNKIINSISTVSTSDEEKINLARKYCNYLSENGKAKFEQSEKLKTIENQVVELKRKEEEERKKIKSGDTFSSNKWQVTYKGTYLTDKICPDNISGYYMYYSVDDDSIFVDIRFRIKNIDVGNLNINNLVSSVKLTYDTGYTYTSYNMYYSDNGRISPVYSWDGLQALDSTTLHVVVKIPREAKSNNKPIKIELGIAGEQKIIAYR